MAVDREHLDLVLLKGIDLMTEKAEHTITSYLSEKNIQYGASMSGLFRLAKRERIEELERIVWPKYEQI
jgi:hypothetical protein